MNKKLLGFALAFVFLAMMVTPVFAAIGPTKVPLGKNKNLVNQAGNMVWMFNQGGVFTEWNVAYRLMRQNASKVNIGNAVDASEWAFPPNEPATCFVMLLMAETRWVYLDQTGMYNLLVGFGFPTTPVDYAAIISSQFPEGVYYKADMVGNY